MKNNNYIVILGPQGSGKGTQARFISKKLKIPSISTGDIFRENIKKGTVLGKRAAKVINIGKLMPDSITNALVKSRISKEDARKGWILDGFPRNLGQAEFLDKIREPNMVVEVWVSDSEVMRRISGRRSCLNCGGVYHLIYKPPKRKGVCDHCGKRLAVRGDDKPSAIKKRLKIYHKQTEALAKYYKKKGVLSRIDGRPSIREVSTAIQKLISKK